MMSELIGFYTVAFPISRMHPTVIAGGPMVYVSNPQPIASRDRMERLLVPVLPLPVAIVCCVFNFLLPGFGTAIAGVSTFCCGSTKDYNRKSEKWMSCLSGFGIGFAQLISTVCLIGLIWSWSWGVYMVYNSYTHYNKDGTRPNTTYSATFVHIESPAPVMGQPFFSGLQNAVVETSFMTPPIGTNQNPQLQNGYSNPGNSAYNQNGISVESDYVTRVRLP